jgi:hypothetical protein
MSEELNEEEITEINIDLTQGGELNEFIGSPSTMLGGQIKFMLGMMFGGKAGVPVNIRGNKSQVDSFTRAMAGEKSYIKTAAKYGLDNPRTYKSKYKLQSAISKFERATGIKWPVK